MSGCIGTGNFNLRRTDIFVRMKNITARLMVADANGLFHRKFLLLSVPETGCYQFIFHVEGNGVDIGNGIIDRHAGNNAR